MGIKDIGSLFTVFLCGAVMAVAALDLGAGNPDKQFGWVHVGVAVFLMAMQIAFWRDRLRGLGD